MRLPYDAAAHFNFQIYPPQSVILDPFIGSGTTSVACIKDKRHYVGFELDPNYYKLAVKRIKEFSMQLTLF